MATARKPKPGAVTPVPPLAPMTFSDWAQVGGVVACLLFLGFVVGCWWQSSTESSSWSSRLRVIDEQPFGPRCAIYEHDEHPMMSCQWPQPSKAAAPPLTFPMPEMPDAQLN
jgi:hypothetical protein